MTFYQRFNIEIDLEEARIRFVNRIHNHIFIGLLLVFKNNNKPLYEYIAQIVASRIGVKHESKAALIHSVNHYVKDDFTKCLLALEAIHNALESGGHLMTSSDTAEKTIDGFNGIVLRTISESEVDLGVSWKNGIFTRTGAKFLDEGLVNESLQWLSDPKYSNVLEPFKKGLGHYMESIKRPELSKDTITEMYESLEALAKIVTNRPTKDLSENRELLVKELDLSEYYKKMLKDHISYANEFRHAVEEGRDRLLPSPKEVEAFVYTTGLFIRLAISQKPTK